MLEIAQCLDQASLEAVTEAARQAPYESGELTAGRSARLVKANRQAADSAETRGALELVAERLQRNELFRAAAQPKALVRLLLSRYQPGMAYGRHVDDAFMEGQRTDLSFTLFLSEPATYQGGELVLEDTSGERAFKLAAGNLLLYPSTYVHWVNEVTEGERLAVVGWVRSRVRDPQHRQALFDLELALQEEFQARGKTEQFDRLSKTRSNLLRLWAED